MKKMGYRVLALMVAFWAVSSWADISETAHTAQSAIETVLADGEGEVCPAPVAAEGEVEDAGIVLASGCCKICRKGKACGNSCINRSYTCRQPPGCACDG